MRFFRRKKTEVLEDVTFEVVQEHPALVKVESEERPFATLAVKIGDSPALPVYQVYDLKRGASPSVN